jgi:hypothetical protein
LSEENWAVVSLRIASDTLTAQEISNLLGTVSDAGSDAVWTADLTDDRDLLLDDQLKLATAWLQDRSAALAAMTGADIALQIGWTPRNPQDGIALGHELIAVLHEIRGYLLLDTYLD